MTNVYVHPVLKTKDAPFRGNLLTTVNTYETIPDTDKATNHSLTRGFGRKIITLSAVANALQFRILGSMDDGTYVPLMTDIYVPAGCDIRKGLDEPWDYTRIQVRPAFANAHGTGFYQIGAASV